MKIRTAIIILMTVLVMQTSHAQLGPGNSHAKNPNGIPACEEGTVGDLDRYPCKAIILFQTHLANSQRNTILNNHALQHIKNFTYQNASAVVIPNEKALQRLQSNPSVAAVIPDRDLSIQAPPPGKGKNSDTGDSGGSGDTSAMQILPEGVASIQAAPGQLTQTGVDIGVAIVDTGIDLANKDLTIGSACFTQFDSCNDDHGHGTHVAGIAAANDNDLDVVGVAPKAVVYAVKVLDSTGSGSDSDLIAGLEWIQTHAANLNPRIRVINLSLSRPGQVDDNPVLKNAISALVDANIVVVVAAGNNRWVDVSEVIPAAYPDVITVASTTAEDGSSKCRSLDHPIYGGSASYFTTDGLGVTVSAPGNTKEDINRQCNIISQGILSLNIGGGTIARYGTSMAAPHVAGVVALMFEKNPTLTSSQVKEIIEQSAERIGEAPYESPISGYTYDGVKEGIVNAINAIAYTP